MTLRFRQCILDYAYKIQNISSSICRKIVTYISKNTDLKLLKITLFLYLRG